MVITKLFSDANKDIDTVCCIGFFDAIHEGHKELIRKTVDIANERGFEAGLITFDKDPLDIITGHRIPQVNTFRTRVRLFEELGIRRLYVVSFDAMIMNMEPATFIDQLLDHIRIRTLVCGFDFHFGRKALGNVETLLKDKRFETVVIPEKTYKNQKISTTRIKKALLDGDIDMVNSLLGHIYSLTVKDGYIENAKELMLPKNGTYSALVNGKAVTLVLKKDAIEVIDRNDEHLSGTNEVLFI